MYENPGTIATAIRKASSEFGHLELLVMPDSRLTFGEAERLSRVLARRLLSIGVGKGSRIGLFFTYSPEFVIAWLAACRIGALAMPMSTLYSPAELRSAMRRGDMSVVLVSASMFGTSNLDLFERAVPSLAEAQGETLAVPELPYLRRIIVLGDEARPWCEAWAVGSQPNDPRFDDELFAAAETEVRPGDAAIVIHTSGSTAEPKGVIHTHGSLMRDASWLPTRQGSSPQTPMTIFCGMAFFWVGGILCIVGAIQGAMRLLAVPKFDPGAALDIIEREVAQDILAWPTLIARMRAHPSYGARALEPCGPLTHGNVDFMLNDTPIEGVPRHRGMSETLGTYAGVEFKVIDPQSGERLPEREEGELLVRGPGLMAGYYKRERVEIFDPDGWYHTGDRAVEVDGVAYFVGRYTEMIKTQGANVAPREVELVLEAHPAIRQAFVFGIPSEDREQDVAAAVVWSGEPLEVDALRAELRDQISPYKIPRHVLTLSPDGVPSLGSGKPDKLTMKSLVISQLGAQ
jgi:acyl-CoA synthetase (AMP-forming)/AMP-acid ligase II